MSSRKFEQELASGCQYEPLPSLPEADLPDLVGGESYEWAAIDNLDVFFTRIYRYWHDKGLVTILVGRLLNLAALAFTICFSGFLLLAVNWAALHSECLVPHDPHASCDILEVALHKNLWSENPQALVGLVGLYLGLCGVYWLWSAVQLVCELRDVLDVKHFINNKLGISDRQIRMMTWSELLHRLVLVQRTSRLCASRDLDELDIVGRIMRKDNYLIGMLNAGVLGLYVRGFGPLIGRRFMLTKTLEWNLYLCILDPMFDEHFHIRQDFIADEGRLRRRLVAAAAVNLVLSPFLLMFLVIYFFMKHAERFYHSPGSLGSRRWSSLAKWRLRELNELPHYIQHRLDASYEAAVKYVGQFPSPLVSKVAKFVSFVAGSFAALLLGLSLLDENLLEVPLGGRNVVWWIALTGILLTISRSFINDTPVAFDPERAMAELVLHTHYLPRHWRGRAHSAEVQQSINSMFTFKVLLFVEELASVVLTPFILAYSLPRCAGAILQFVSDHTTRIEGVGDVCSLAAFDFSRHGNSKYGAPAHAAKRLRSKQGKMEKSFITFVATYPTWQPPQAGKQMLNNIGSVSCQQPLQQQGSPAAAAVEQRDGYFGAGAGAGAAAAAAAAGGQGAGLGEAADLVDGTVLWQQPHDAQQQQHHHQQQGGYGDSSIWVGVAEQPPVLRHPNYQQRAPAAQQRLQQQRQQQQHIVNDMGAGLGGLGSSPDGGLVADLDAGLTVNDQQEVPADLLSQPQERLHSAQLQEVHTQQQQGEVHCAQDAEDESHLHDLADHLFGPLSPDRQPQSMSPKRQQQQQGSPGWYRAQQKQKPPAGRLPVPALGSVRQAVAGGRSPPAPHLGPSVRGGVGLRFQGGGSSSSMMLSRPHLHQQQCQEQVPLLPPPAATAAAPHVMSQSRYQKQQQQQQHYHHHMQQQQQQHSMLHLHPHPSIHMGDVMAPSQQLLQLYPSSLYPGGPTAAAALSQLQLHHYRLQQQQQPGNCSIALNALGASLLAQSAAGSDFLPTNETDDLSSRVAASQSLLQSFYEGQDLTVQHRQHNRMHARSVLLGHNGSAAAAAAAVAAMAAASASHGAVPSGDW